MTGWPSLGIVPWFADAAKLPAEDAVDLAKVEPNPDAPLKIAAPILPRIANFDDLDPLKLDPAVALTLVPPGSPLPADADLIILPGSKATIADLAALRREGWDIDLRAHHRRGGRVLGLCGGYQMLGRTIADPGGLEGEPASVEGLGLLDVETVMIADKTVRPVTATHAASGTELTAYEIHLGETRGEDGRRAPFRLGGKPEGAASPDGRVVGTYLHGLFSADAFRRAFLSAIQPDLAFGGLAYETTVEDTLDRLADHLAEHLDTGRILAIAQERR
jgi:adenosylcobyric acid synthase